MPQRLGEFELAHEPRELRGDDFVRARYVRPGKGECWADIGIAESVGKLFDRAVRERVEYEEKRARSMDGKILLDCEYPVNAGSRVLRGWRVRSTFVFKNGREKFGCFRDIILVEFGAYGISIEVNYDGADAGGGEMFVDSIVRALDFPDKLPVARPKAKVPPKPEATFRDIKVSPMRTYHERNSGIKFIWYVARFRRALVREFDGDSKRGVLWYSNTEAKVRVVISVEATARTPADAIANHKIVAEMLYKNRQWTDPIEITKQTKNGILRGLRGSCSGEIHHGGKVSSLAERYDVFTVERFLIELHSNFATADSDIANKAIDQFVENIDLTPKPTTAPTSVPTSAPR